MDKKKTPMTVREINASLGTPLRTEEAGSDMGETVDSPENCAIIKIGNGAVFVQSTQSARTA